MHDVAWILDVVKKAGVTDWAVQAPGRASGLIGARRAVELMLQHKELDNHPVALLEDPAGLRESGEQTRGGLVGQMGERGRLSGVRIHDVFSPGCGHGDRDILENVRGPVVG